MIKSSTLIFLFIFSVIAVRAQVPDEYTKKVAAADSLYFAHNYVASSRSFSEAFRANGWKAFNTDRYNAACNWALAGNVDSALYHLEYLERVSGYKNYQHITSDEDLKSLYTDLRWSTLLVKVKTNKDKAEEHYNRPLVEKLEGIYNEDQKYRAQLSRLPQGSPELKLLWDTINMKDSLNLLQIIPILDEYGWLGEDVVGPTGNSALFLVIQHSDQQTQEKYLPMMREAVKNGKAAGSSLALLEDRVALGQGKRQIYGSQIGTNYDTNTKYVLPLEDPDNVDKRRESVGLPPLAQYVLNWNLKWDPEQYKKDLPGIEAILTRRK